MTRRGWWLFFLGTATALAIAPIWFDDGAELHGKTADNRPIVGPLQGAATAPPTPVGIRSIPQSPDVRSVIDADAMTAWVANTESLSDRWTQRTITDSEIDAFPSREWRQPAVPLNKGRVAKIAPPPPLAPAAPHLPFNYMGRIEDANGPRIFLLAGDKTMAVREGDVIDSLYRVESVRGTQMTLLYLPLNIPQILTIGRAQ